MNGSDGVKETVLIELMSEVDRLFDQVEKLYNRVDEALEAEFEGDCDCDELEPVYELEGINLHDLADLLEDIGLDVNRKYSVAERMELRTRLEGV